VNDYETICYSSLKEKGNSSQICEQKVIGSHYEDKVIWKEFSREDLQKGKTYTIGVFTNVKKGDSVEWIPTFYGVKIEEWAEWEESLNTGLVAYYKLDKTSGVVVDALGNYDGTNNGATRGVTGKINKSFQFVNADNDYVDTNHIFDMENALTWSVWFNTGTTYNYILSQSYGGADTGGYSLKDDGSGYFGFIKGSGSGSSTILSTTKNLKDNSWHYVAVTYDGISTWKFYIDGVLEDTATHTGSNTHNREMWFGRRPDGSTTSFEGKIDEIGIWNRTLNSTEIVDLYNNGDGITYKKRNAPDKPSLNSPADNSQIIETSPVLNVTVTDPDSQYLNVSFYDRYGAYLSSEEWLKIRANNNNTCYTTNHAPDDITQNVTFADVGGSVESSPVVANGYVYVGSNDGKVYQLNALNLSLVNSYDTGSPINITPTLDSDYIYVSSNRTLYKLSATDLSYIGNYTINRRIISSPVVDAGSVYFLDNQTLYKLSATDLSYIGNYTKTFYHEFFPVLAVVNGYIYAMDKEGAGGESLYQIYNSTLGLANYFFSSRGLGESFAISNGYVYVSNHESKVYQLYINNLSAANTYELDDWAYRSPIAVANGYVYILDLSDKLYQLNATDLSYIRSVTGYNCDASLVVTDDYLYVHERSLFQLNVTDMSLVNSYTTGEYSEPAIANGFAYVTGGSHDIYRLGEGVKNFSPKKLHTQTNVANNSAVTYTWEGLSTDETYYWYVEATDGTSTTQSDIWNFTIKKLIINSESYSSSTMEGNTETFIINVSINPSYQISTAKLIYDGVPYSSTFSKSGNEYFISKELDVPKVNADENKSFYWSIKLDDDTIYNSTTHNQTILNIDIDDCSSNHYELLNITLYDEISLEPIKGDLEILYTLLKAPSYEVMSVYNLSAKNITNKRICSSINLSGEDLFYSLEARYKSVGYKYAGNDSYNFSTELYHIQKASINSSNTKLFLYPLRTDKSTEFKIIYQDNNYNFVEGAVIQLLRKYISENKYRIVEAPITSSDGTTNLHIDLDANKYKIIVVKDGE
ncbi:MAG: PQQ-binding-like beta-propeller repeat protein, partial [Clostridiales bacterium]|nr:PQQ-binding-like beta-propeller repeat protein [Clostridiales bacterium]